MYQKKTAIMCTGGLDSTALLYMNKDKKPIPITVDFGQAAFAKQVELLNYHISELNLPDLQIIKVTYHEKEIGLFTKGYVPKEENPLEDWDKVRYKDFFVEGRNAIMLMYVLAYCSSNKIDEVLTGYLYSSNEWQNRRTMKLMTGDNSPQFIDAVNILSQYGFSYQTRVRAPFYEQGIDKEYLINYYQQNKIPIDKTYSCYFIPECGVCDNCLLRQNLNIK